ncbi:hypothetical protein Trisim1_003227 [Trichoderma cf. simile WF8]
MSPSPCRISLEETDPIPAAGNTELSTPQQGSQENSDNESSCIERPFALGQWLAESQKDEPFNALASARDAASEQAAAAERTGTSSTSRAPPSGPSSLGYINNAPAS